MAKDERVNLTVSPEQKERWETAVEESPEYSSLADLIRQSVEYELADSTGAATAPQGPPQPAETAQTEAHAEALEQVTDTLARMESTLSELDDRLTSVEQEVTAPARTDLKNKVFDALPEDENVSAKQVADDIGADRERVSSVLTQLEEQTGAVEVAGEIDGQQFYTRREDK